MDNRKWAVDVNKQFFSQPLCPIPAISSCAMECQYVATQRGGVALVFEGHRYNKVRDGKDGTVYWRCSRDRQCPGRAVTVNNRVKKANNKHNHPPEASLRNGLGSGSVSGSISSAPVSAGSTGSSQSIGSSHSPANHRPAPFHHQQQHQHPLRANPSHPSLNLVAHNSILHNQAPNLNLSNHNMSHLRLPSSLALQDVLDAQSAAHAHAAAAVSYPDIVTETLQYLAAASGNHQSLAAAFASSMANMGGSIGSPSLKNIDRALALVSPSTPFIGSGGGLFF